MLNFMKGIASRTLGAFGSSSSSSSNSGGNNHSTYNNNDSIRDHQHDNSTHYRGDTSSTSKKKKQHSAILSALWALARTPSLVEAIEREECLDELDGKQLSTLLRELGQDTMLIDRKRLREAMETAEAFLAASPPSRFASMEPFDAMRGIIGLCVDSTAVLESAMQAVYYREVSCSICKFRIGRREAETQLKCNSETAQLEVEVRANTATTKCDTCNWPGAAEVRSSPKKKRRRGQCILLLSAFTAGSAHA